MIRYIIFHVPLDIKNEIPNFSVWFLNMHCVCAVLLFVFTESVSGYVMY